MTVHEAPDYDNFALIVDVETLEMPKSVLGEIWIWTPDFEFPERGWTDLVVAVLRSFLEEAYMLLGGREHSSIWFMRGPLQVDITRKSTEVWAIEGITRNASRTREVHVRRELVLDQILSSSVAALRACQRHGWSSKEIVGLDVGIARLEREMRYQRAAGRP